MMRTTEIPYWEKYMLTLREAAEYFHIGCLLPCRLIVIKGVMLLVNV